MSRAASGGRRRPRTSAAAAGHGESGAPPRAVFFDIGDTLVRRPTVGPGRRIAAALGLPAGRAADITRLVFREPFASPAALAERLRREFGLARAPRAAIAAIWRAQEEEPVEVEGATECVVAARRAGARVGVISNIWPPYEAGFRRACPAIVPLIESWHLSYRQGVAKPDRALFRAALAALDVTAARAVMVGDSLEKDVLPALALGMTAVWVLPEEPGDAGSQGGRTGAAASALVAPPRGCSVVHGLRQARAVVLAALGGEGAGKSRAKSVGSRSS